jgi:tyrosine decarboxylase/aspartate 1-decarboxylase
MVLEKSSLKLLQEALEELETGFQKLPRVEPLPDQKALGSVLFEVAERMKK